MKIEIPDELMESIKTQIAEFEKENKKPKDVIDYEYGWIIVNDKARQAVDFLNETIRKSYSIGLYRDTQEEAEKLLRKMNIEHRLRQWAKMCKEKVNWSNSKQYKFYMCVEDNYVKIDWLSDRKESSIYFTDKSILQLAIEDISEQNLIDNYFVEV